MKACPHLLDLFGKDLKTWLYDDPGGWTVLPVQFSTWLEGGCWMLARALHDWTGAPMWTLYSTETSSPFSEMPQHVLVKVGGCFLDGDGASTEEQLLHRWATQEGLVDPTLKPFVLEDVEEFGLECPIGGVKDLVRGLGRTFGDGEAVLRWAK